VKLNWFILLLFSFYTGLHAQSKYSTDPNYIKSAKEQNGTLSEFESDYADTSVNATHRFIPRNFSGNLNLSSPDYILNFNTPAAGFRLYQVPLRDYKIGLNDVAYHYTKGPYAQLTGIAGTQQLQLFRMIFANSFKNNFSLSLKLNRYTSQGFYSQQQGSTNNFYVAANYITHNKRFGFNSFVLVNNNKFQENGGIKGDTMAEANLLVNKTLFPVKISRGSRENRELTARYNNWFRLNKNSESGMQTFLYAYGQFSQQKYKYKDDNSGSDRFYLLYYLDTLSTKDSTRVFQFNNGAGINLKSHDQSFSISGGYENEAASIWQRYDTLLTNHLLKVNVTHHSHLKTKDSAIIDFKNIANISYILAGNQASDFMANTGHQFRFIKNTKSVLSGELKLMLENRTADYLFRRWYSNHFIWENTFKPVQTVGADLNLGNKYIRIGATLKSIQNYVYLDQLGYPMQQAGSVTNTAFRIQANYVFFRHLGVSLTQQIQSSSSNVISLPGSVSMGSLYYTGNLFKNNLNLCLGAELEYFSKFTPYAYMPATQQFVVQDRFSAGEFPFLDIYLNARIKPVNIFLKMENVLHGLMGTNYSMVPGYFQPDRAFRFGLTWTFFD
jgi:hypothetical protein